MSPGEPNTPPTEPVIPLSAIFCADDADVVIRALGTCDFRVHKIVLSLVSPIFKDMFTIPQPPTNTPSALPHVDVHEPAETWEHILRAIYHMPNPVIDDLNDLESLLLAAKKYEMQFILDSQEKNFRDIRFIQRDPLHLYAIACACGLEDQAKYVARNAESPEVIRRPQGDDLKGLTLASHRRLITFLFERDTELHPILEEGWKLFYLSCHCHKERGASYGKVKEKLKMPYIPMEEVYFGALEERPLSTCGWPRCMAAVSNVKEFLERMFEERNRVCDKFMW